MRAVAGLALLLFSGVARAAALPQTPHQTYDALKALRIDPAAVYKVQGGSRIELRRGDLLLTFDEGKMAFLAPWDGRVTGLVFSGRGHTLAAPRDPQEKQQLARFLGAPVLDQDFSSAYVRFTDDTAAELLRQFLSAKMQPDSDAAFAALWEPLVIRLNPVHSLRILFDDLSETHRPFFYAAFEGLTTGPFDFLFDEQHDEPFMLGQPRKIGDVTFFDIWASYRTPGTAPGRPRFRAVSYSIDTTVLTDRSLSGSALVGLRAVSSGERIITFQLSRRLSLDSVTDADGHNLEYFQNEGMPTEELSSRGTDVFSVVLAQPSRPEQEIKLQFRYHGAVIEDSGNGVLFVSARESWYPHFGDAASFADYELTMRWPRKLRMVATGTKLGEHEEGEMRVGRWKTEKPVSVAGFNLGDYASASQSSGSYTVEVFANKQLEQALNQRLASPSVDLSPGLPAPFGRNSGNRMDLPQTAPSPAAALKQLSREIDSSIRFYEKFSGPFPYRSLSVSQIPGTFGQGWPGLLYLSTYSFLSSDAQQRAGLSTAGQEHFTELVPFHEAAHQWWGNVVGWPGYRDQWIDESIANYLCLLFADAKKDPERTLHVWLDRYRHRLLEKPASGGDIPADIGSLSMGMRLSSSKSPHGFEEVIYSKGSWVIHMLHEMLKQRSAKNPDARFTQLLQALAAKYAYRGLSTSDFQREVEAVMTPSMDLEGGRSMEWFFDQWVRGTGVPYYRVEFTTRQTEKGFQIRGKLLQTGVPKSFIAPVPLYASSGGRDVFLGTVTATGPETAFRFSVAAPPRKIRVDPQMTLLCASD